MEPRQARRGTAAVAGSTLVVGVVLVVLAFVLAACGGGSRAATSDTSASPSTTASTSTPAPSSPSSGVPATTSVAPGTAVSTPTPAGAGAGADTTQPPVALDQTATFTAGLTASVVSVEPISATAALPGEVAGPAVRITLTVQNGAATALDLGNVTVDLQDTKASSATPLSANGSQSFTGSLAPGATATGIYVFTLPTDDRAGVTLYVTASASLPVVVFTGDLT